LLGLAQLLGIDLLVIFEKYAIPDKSMKTVLLVTEQFKTLSAKKYFTMTVNIFLQTT
jgi:hypothetical protein